MRIIKVALVTSALLVGLTAQAVSATHLSAGSPDQVLKSVAQRCVGGVKIDDPQSGVAYAVQFPDAGGTGWSGSITFTLTNNGQSLAFKTDHPTHLVTAVWVAGGPTYAWAYFFPGGTDADSGLTAPLNPKSGKPFGVSHVCLTLEKK